MANVNKLLYLMNDDAKHNRCFLSIPRPEQPMIYWPIIKQYLAIRSPSMISVITRVINSAFSVISERTSRWPPWDVLCCNTDLYTNIVGLNHNQSWRFTLLICKNLSRHEGGGGGALVWPFNCLNHILGDELHAHRSSIDTTTCLKE